MKYPLKEIEALAGAFFEPSRIARVLELDFEDFQAELMNPESEVFKAYYKGFDQAEFEHRKSIIQLAKQGSPQAQEQVKRYISNTKSKLDE
jgi:hypothetical protein